MNILTLVHLNGIVNQYQVIQDLDDPDNLTLCQFIWNDMINCYVVGLNKEPIEHAPGKNTFHIKDYRAIYLNGIMIVKNGKVYPKKPWYWRFKNEQ